METLDVSDTITPKSNQLNADDLIAGPITVSITKVARSSEEQPIAVHISGGHKPYMPCKTMRRIMVQLWGSNGLEWVGKSLTLYRDAAVKFGSDEVGGIRISAMSDIPKAQLLSVTATRGRKVPHRITVLATNTGPMDLATFRKWCGWAVKNGWTEEQVKAELGGPAADVPPADYATIVAALKAGPVITTEPDITNPTEGEI